MNNKIIAIIAILAVVIGGWMIFRNNDVDTDMASVDQNVDEGASSPAPTSAGTGSTASVKEFTVTGSSFAFAPKTLAVNKGDTVKINFVNSGGMHDFRIDEFNVKTAVLQGGNSQSATFVADKAGTFEYYCSVGTHRQMGMVGTLTVK